MGYALEGDPFQSELRTFDQLAGGTYKVIAMDSLMCSDTLSLSLSMSLRPLFCWLSQPTHCVTVEHDGAILATAEGGTGDISYELGGETSATGNFEGLDAGPYTVFRHGCKWL